VSDAQVLVETSAANSVDKEVTARCPDGKIAIGGGARVLGATTPSASDIPEGVALVATFPVGGTGAPTAEWTAIAKEIAGGVLTDWRLSVSVVCANVDEGE
jgi:hypothetical protein